MDKHIRIHTTPLGGDKYVNINLKQKFDVLDILSLSIKKEDLYRNFESNYGVLVGRININTGLGVPNAKVSIFIPLDETDAEDTKISSIYPYEEINDKNILGYRYNLFTPREGYDLGSFPTKLEIIKDKTMSEVYKKYYKYTTVTNGAGDFMIFGLPVGSHTLHVDIDLSDIGEYSYSPKELKNSGVPNNSLILGEDGEYIMKVDSNLESLPQIISQNVTVDIRPLWGNIDEQMVGITRCDVNFNINFNTYSTFVATMGFERLQKLEDKGILWSKDFAEMYWYNNTKYGRSDESNYTPGEDSRVLPFIGEQLGQPLGDVRVRVYMYDESGGRSEMMDYVREENATLVADGFLILKLPCYSHKVITDEYGETKFSTDGSGVPTAGTYHIEVITDDGYVQTGGEFYGYMIRNNSQNEAKRGFLMERGRIYTASFKHVKNKREVFGMKRSTSMKLGGITFFGKDRLNISGSKQLPFSFNENDWLNGFLYFGRMANGGDKKNQSAPVDMQYSTEGRLFYKVETRMVDITSVIENMSKTDNYYHFFNNTNLFTLGQIEQPKLMKADIENNGLPKPLSSNRGGGQFMIMSGMYLSNVNNFKKYYNLVKK